MIYDESTARKIYAKIPEIVKEIDEKKKFLAEPTIFEYREVMGIIKGFVIEKKRKIYGGWALNEIIRGINPDDMIYGENDTPDIDFYSPEPLQDMYALCDLLQASGFKFVSGRQAQHIGTYKISVNFQEMCDITYVPKIIYSKMSVLNINGYRYTNPIIMLIDYYRQYNDINSTWRLEKAFMKMFRLQKYCPVTVSKNAVVLQVPKLSSIVQTIIGKLTRELFNTPELAKNLVIIGNKAYNYYLNASGYDDIGKYFVREGRLEVIAAYYVSDTVLIYNFIKEYLEKEGNVLLLKIVEYHPFYQFTGYRNIIQYDGEDIIMTYHNNNLCIPYNNVSIQYKDSTTVNHRFSTYAYISMFLLIDSFRSWVYNKEKDDKSESDTYKIMYLRLLDVRNRFLKEHDLIPIDKKSSNNIPNPYTELQIRCHGNLVSFERAHKIRMKEKKDSKKPYSFSYDPTIKRDPPVFSFPNTSGNIITSPKFLKINLDNTSENNNLILSDTITEEDAIAEESIDSSAEDFNVT